MMEAVWAGQIHTLDPVGPTWVPQCTKCYSSSFIGHAPGIYADFALAEFQTQQYPGYKWEGSFTELEATTAHTN